jgi:hypothetical protein
MSFSEQVPENHLIATQRAFFVAPHKLHTCSVQSAPFNVDAIRKRKTPTVANGSQATLNGALCAFYFRRLQDD